MLQYSNKCVPLHYPMTNDMPRRVRKISGTGIYHVMLRGINRQDIFEDDEDYRQMIGLLHNLTERRGENGLLLQPLCTFYAYCLMSNHVHLLIRERAEIQGTCFLVHKNLILQHIGIKHLKIIIG